jgi:glycosyltransferase involved in cell wall biosynthesis
MSGIHQFVPMLHRGDAVGRHTLRLRDLMVARGIDSRIYVELSDPQTEGETAPASTYPEARQPGDVLVYQFATASDLAPWLAARGETLVVNYHNITPPELFAAWDNRLALHQVRARSELNLMSARTALGIAVSAFNRRDLDAAGYGTTAVVPPAAVLPPAVLTPRNGARTADRLPADRGSPRRGARWLSVGRMAPNKAIEDVVMALLVARSSYDPDTMLTIVGKPVIASYTSAVHRIVCEVGLEESVRFLGHASDADLAAAYAEADVLVVASGHEGFGVPLIEAMSVGLPIVMSAAGALPEVVGGAGVVTDTTDPWALAGTVAELLGDGERCRTLAAAGRAQLEALDLPTAGDRMIDLVCALR